MILSVLLATSALAGAPAGFTSGVEGQRGFGPPAVSPDGASAALTGWDRAGLWVLDLENGALQAVSQARGAGFHPVWDGEALLFKAIAGSGQPEQQVLRWQGGRVELLDRGGRVGQPEVLAPGQLLWAHGDTLRRLAGGRIFAMGAVGDVDLVEPDPRGERLAWDDAHGQLHVRSLKTGYTYVIDPGRAGSHPAWSGDGALLLHHTPGGELRVLDPDTGALRAAVDGAHPAWVPGTHNVVFERVETGTPEEDSSPYTVRTSSLWTLDVDTGSVRPLLREARLHPRYATPVGETGDLLFVDSRSGDLWRLRDGVPTHLLSALRSAAPPPPPDTTSTSVSVPYMHQLWDTPDDFNGGWSCGPTSCVQVLSRWSTLPDADITCSWPSSHTSHWGWYIPNAYSFGGYTYDTWGEAAGGTCQGAHGFICREYGGAVWAYMTDFMARHGVESAQVGTDFNTVISQTDAGYPMYASVSVLGYGHILVVRGYLSVDGSAIHSLVVNDPYGNAGSGDWGNFDGEGITYDWPGYNNGHLEIEVAQLFTAHGVDAPDPVDTGTATPVDTGTATPVDTGTPTASDSSAATSGADSTATEEPDTRHQPGAPGELTEMGELGGSGCATGGGARSALWVVGLLGILALGRRRR